MTKILLNQKTQGCALKNPTRKRQKRSTLALPAMAATGEMWGIEVRGKVSPTVRVARVRNQRRATVLSCKRSHSEQEEEEEEVKGGLEGVARSRDTLFSFLRYSAGV